MLALRGTYKNGFIKLDNPLNIDKPLKVIITFIDEEVQLNYQSDVNKQEKKTIDINKFSFLQSIEASKDFQDSFSDSLIDERRSEL
ncbi:MAG: hypothetical protein B6I20_04055 [Bacteroidetes bacterium 4572_117]|nr:MAG: hypothetical protein B6I20_04055 [Bacteroidetes bacterium 4572_117]